MKAITSFSGECGWLSNFSPCAVNLDGVWYPTVENAYQAAKTDDLEARGIFRGITAGKAKREGRKLLLRPDWEGIKLGVMKSLLKQKFQVPVFYREKLLATGTAHLEEGNHWGDTFWGTCNGIGENNLGRLLMEVRNELQQ